VHWWLDCLYVNILYTWKIGLNNNYSFRKYFISFNFVRCYALETLWDKLKNNHSFNKIYIYKAIIYDKQEKKTQKFVYLISVQKCH